MRGSRFRRQVAVRDRMTTRACVAGPFVRWSLFEEFRGALVAFRPRDAQPSPLPPPPAAGVPDARAAVLGKFLGKGAVTRVVGRRPRTCQGRARPPPPRRSERAEDLPRWNPSDPRRGGGARRRHRGGRARQDGRARGLPTRVGTLRQERMPVPGLRRREARPVPLQVLVGERADAEGLRGTRRRDAARPPGRFRRSPRRRCRVLAQASCEVLRSELGRPARKRSPIAASRALIRALIRLRASIRPSSHALGSAASTTRGRVARSGSGSARRSRGGVTSRGRRIAPRDGSRPSPRAPRRSSSPSDSRLRG